MRLWKFEQHMEISTSSGGTKKFGVHWPTTDDFFQLRSKDVFYKKYNLNVQWKICSKH